MKNTTGVCRTCRRSIYQDDDGLWFHHHVSRSDIHPAEPDALERAGSKTMTEPYKLGFEIVKADASAPRLEDTWHYVQNGLYARQCRFPRSKKRRIRKKWSLNPDNYALYSLS
jgi:hypothetical protein